MQQFNKTKSKSDNQLLKDGRSKFFQVVGQPTSPDFVSHVKIIITQHGSIPLGGMLEPCMRLSCTVTEISEPQGYWGHGLDLFRSRTPLVT